MSPAHSPSQLVCTDAPAFYTCVSLVRTVHRYASPPITQYALPITVSSRQLAPSLQIAQTNHCWCIPRILVTADPTVPYLPSAAAAAAHLARARLAHSTPLPLALSVRSKLDDYTMSAFSERLDCKVKFILVSGGVISGIGKGLTASSIGVLMKCCGWKVTAIKIDPYVNIDAGTMSPSEHGEVFVLTDGGEADLDLGNYERFLDVKLCRENNITTGKIFKKVIDAERRGDYLGKTVQYVPHLTDCIINWIVEVATRPNPETNEVPEICVIELGGTVGDVESSLFVEALRQLRYMVGDDNFCSVFVSLVPEVGDKGEQKTKPTQHGVKTLSSLGLSPHILVCRSVAELSAESKRKLALFCQVPSDAVISVYDVSNTYNIPLILQDQGVCNLLIRNLKLVWSLPKRLEKWGNMARAVDMPGKPKVNICIVGKYTTSSDAYLSVVRALQHATMALNYELCISWVESTELVPPTAKVSAVRKPLHHISDGKGADEHPSPTASPSRTPIDHEALHDHAWERLRRADGILVPGGFGDRGVEGKILAIRHARTEPKPFLGICLGMQMAVVEMARAAFGDPRANSTEFDVETKTPAIIFMPEGSKTQKGGTMRLGTRTTHINYRDCLASWLYNADQVYERHRHRYEVNPELISRIETETDMYFSGTDDSRKRMEIVEMRSHPFYMATQYHPEFESRPGRPSPPFLGFIMAAGGQTLTKDSISENLKIVARQDPWVGPIENGKAKC